MNLPILSEWSEAIKSSTPPFSRKGRGSVDVVVCPPFTHIERVGKLLGKTRIKLGAQDVFWKSHGAYTGEVSPFQLKALGVRYVIVGHSERRALGETDKVVNKKVKAALSAGLKVILCVGESLTVRKRGFANAKNFVKKQLTKDLKGIGNCLATRDPVKKEKLKIENLLIAYEPLWAIGTGRAAAPADATVMARFIKELLVVSRKSLVRVLYGGSVNAGNVGAFLAEPDINGALVGGASLKPREFKKMIVVASSL